jgi:transcription elongation factor
MRLIIITTFILLSAIVGVKAQDAQQCPVDMVCLSRPAALKAVENAATVKAQAEQIKTLQQAVQDEKEVANKLKIEYAETKGELTAVKQNAVSDRAIIDLLLKSVKKKCMPLSLCF